MAAQASLVILVIWIFLVVLLYSEAQGVQLSKEDELFNYLEESRKDRTRYGRPVVNASQPVHVNVTAHLLQILSVDAKEQAIRISAYLGVSWYDYRCKWNPADFGGLGGVVVEAETMWLPDIGLVNSLGADFDFSKDREMKLELYHDGRVNWFPGGVYHVGCPVDLTYFPFDQQSCKFIITSWSHSEAKLVLQSPYHTMQVGKIVAKSEWGLNNLSVQIKSASYEISQPSFSFFIITMTTARDPKFYISNIFIPAIIISLLVLTVFILPCESGEKVSLGITILLAFSVFQLVVSDTLPPNAKTTPLILIYLTTLMIATAVSTGFTVLVLNIHHMECDARMGNWARILVYDGIARVTFYKAYHRLRHKDDPETASEAENNKTSVETRNVKILVDAKGPQNNAMLHKSEKGSAEGVDTENCSEIVVLLRKICAWLADLKSKRDVRHLEDAILNEWKEVARIVDRFLLIAYFLALGVITVTFMLVTPLSGER